MLLFLAGIALLIAGYYTYGKFIEKVIGPDDRPTPATRLHDGVDFVVLPHWKNMLIQLLNIAGVGPVIGVIIGIKFGWIAMLIIPIGNIIGGAVHDFIAGMMSIRHDGANLPALIRMTLGKTYYRFFSVFMIVLLLLVVAVFVNIPAGLIDGMFPSVPIFWWAVVAIFLYYICATLFPIDKIIGAIYPVFGALLLLSSVAIFGALLWAAIDNPELMSETEAFEANMIRFPVVPALFVTIACGIISGFHATQSPIIARTIRSERQGRAAFYGMMIVEGIIAMIWAGAAMAIYRLHPEYMLESPNLVLKWITEHFLGTWLGVFAVVGVIVLAITSGDTAMRSLRLSLAEIFQIDQKPIRSRILLCVPLIAVVSGLLWWSNISTSTFQQLWNYFAWGNQVLAASTLFAVTAWLVALRKKNWWTAMAPGIFMSFIVLSYILWISPANGGPVGFGMPLYAAYAIALVLSLITAIYAYRCGIKRRKQE